MRKRLKHSGHCSEDQSQDQQEHNFLFPAVGKKTHAFPHKCIRPEPPLGIASDSLRPETGQRSPDSAAKNMIVGRGENDAGSGVAFLYQILRKFHILIGVA